MRIKSLNVMVLSCLLLNCKQSDQKNIGTSPDENVIVEFAPFAIRKGIAEQELLDASEVMQKGFLAKQSGFLKRELVKKSASEYLDIVYWNSQENADLAMTNAMSSEACAAYFQCMIAADSNDPSMGVTHGTVIEKY